MNIFFLDKTPEGSAEMLCDKHVPKMLLESAQMLSTAVQQYTDTPEGILYKSAYPNHPMTKWVGENKANFKWALDNALWINNEYEYRFKKNHKSFRIIQNILDNNFMWDIPSNNRFSITYPPQCMPDEYRNKNHVTAYRNYYKGEKEYFAKWEKGRSEPKWWN